MIKLTTNNTIITTILGLACLAVVIFVIMPSLKDIIKLSNEIEAQKTALEEMYQRGQGLKKTYQQFDEVKSKITKIEGVLLQEGEELNFITSLEAVANGNSIVQDIRLNTENITQMSGYYTMPIQLTLSGSYKDILSYIVDLEELKYYLNFTHLILNNEDTKMFNSKIKMSENPLVALQTIDNEIANEIRVTIEALSYWQPNKQIVDK